MQISGGFSISGGGMAISNTASASVVPPAGDPDFADTILLVNAENSNVSDLSAASPAHTTELINGALLDTTVTKFGSGSIQLLGNGGYLRVIERDDLDFVSGDFTIEMWLYQQVNSTRGVVGKWNGSTSERGWALYTIGGGSGPTMNFYASNTGAGFSNTVGTIELTLNQWHHVAVTRESGVCKVWIDGVQDGEFTLANFVNTSRNVYFGVEELNGVPNNVPNTCRYDDIRFTAGVARYTAPFTPPGEHPTS